jgi:hypothetical protein
LVYIAAQHGDIRGSFQEFDGGFPELLRFPPGFRPDPPSGRGTPAAKPH